ncbi:MAG TPA: nuclear transport factor 2 family protein [Myxococcota bacterium]|nr:nuclear transport factor 2 family protein [Myxococcota bacterium]
MSGWKRGALLAAVLLGTGAIGAAGEDAPAPADVVAAFHAALAAGDAAAAEALLAPDAIVLESGHVESRSAYVAGHLAADIEFARAVAAKRSDVRVVQEGDVAWVSASSRAEGSFRGRAIRSRGAELIVLARGAQGWRIRAIHWSSHEPKSP